MSAQPVIVFTPNRFVEKLFAHGFFFFFVFEIFSPYISGRTFYIEYFFIAANPFFWNWVAGKKFSKRIFYAVLPAIALGALNPIGGLKLVIVFVGVLYLVYCYERRLIDIIWPYALVSIGVAVAQFIAVNLGFAWLADDLGPTHLSKLVWGSLATPTFTNFYAIFYFPRVSGLSRESGFFASFLVSLCIAQLIHARAEAGSPSSLKRSLPLLIGYVVSFSKSSIAVLLAFIIVKFRSYLDRIPIFFVGFGFLISLVCVWSVFSPELMLSGNVTFLSRFGGYALLPHMSLGQLLFGVQNVGDIAGQLARYIDYVARYGESLGGLAGVGGWCMRNGLIAFCIYMITLRALGIRSSGFLLILLMTATVGFDTNQNFVLLAYYVAFMIGRLPRHPGMAKRSTERRRQLIPYR